LIKLEEKDRVVKCEPASFFLYLYFDKVEVHIFSLGAVAGRDRMVVGFTTLSMQSVHITIDVMSSNLNQGEVYNIM
jgi:hypothetical protein